MQERQNNDITDQWTGIIAIEVGQARNQRLASAISVDITYWAVRARDMETGDINCNALRYPTILI